MIPTDDLQSSEKVTDAAMLLSYLKEKDAREAVEKAEKIESERIEAIKKKRIAKENERGCGVLLIGLFLGGFAFYAAELPWWVGALIGLVPSVIVLAFIECIKKIHARWRNKHPRFL